MKRSCIALFVLFMTAAAPLCLAEAYPDPLRFQADIDAFRESEKNLPVTEGAIIATGSSSMRFWQTIAEDLKPLTIVNRGFGGSNMNDLLFYLDELVLRHAPSGVMIYEGDNDVALGASPDEILDRLDEILERINSSLPTATIYLLHVKPSPSRWDLWPTMQEVNAEFEVICDESPSIVCIDVATPMLDDSGTPIQEIFVEDDLHMNDKGYRIWTNAVRNALLVE